MSVGYLGITKTVPIPKGKNRDPRDPEGFPKISIALESMRIPSSTEIDRDDRYSNKVLAGHLP